MPEVLFWCFAGLGCFGVVLLLSVTLWGAWTNRQLARLSELQAKVVIEAAQQVSGFTGLFVTFAPTADKFQWQATAFASFASCVVWKVVQLAVDWRQKRETARAIATSEVLSRLLVGIHLSVARKFVRVQNAVLGDGRPQTTIAHVRATLTPKPHLDDLLDQLATVLQRGVRTVHVRVGVYVNRAGFMEPIHGVSLQNPGYNPFGSYKSRPEFYRLGDPSEATHAVREVSHVVRCVREHHTIVVSNCQEACAAQDFAFATADQAKYLRSLVVYYLLQAVDSDGASTDAVVAVDADQAGFFQPDDIDSLKLILGEFGLRIRLEMALQAFLERREVSRD